jgi:hypothetical protein
MAALISRAIASMPRRSRLPLPLIADDDIEPIVAYVKKAL